MTHARTAPWWAALLIALVGMGVLYRDALQTGFLNDDYLFLEEARTRPLVESLADPGALGNYYRPLSRQIYFAALTPLAGGAPWVFHLVNALIFTGALVLLVDLLRAAVPWSGVLAGTLYFATLPLQRVNLTWISCSQDLLALLFTLAAMALFRRGRDLWSSLAYLAALASKEVAFPLPVALGAWAWWCGTRGPGGRIFRPAPAALARRLTPFAVVGGLWLVVVVTMRTAHPGSAAELHVTPGHLLAGWVHGVQSLLALEHPGGLLAALRGHVPPIIPLAAFAALAAWIPPPSPAAAAAPGAPPARALVPFAVAWFIAFALPAGPVAYSWSSYYYTLAAVGGALLLGLACRRLDRGTWIGLALALLWWNTGNARTSAFAVLERPWVWTSHLTAFYFERGAELNRTLQRELLAYEPAPEPNTRFFFATLPPWAGFQMGSGPLIRTLYRDPTLSGRFYSQFSESTAAGYPCRFLHWDGARFAPLYPGAREPWFQVGADLLLFGRPAGAAHAFRRGLDAGEARADHLYWLGWAELWRGHRPAAEAAWEAFGARDDPAAYERHLVEARDALLAADSLTARRRLFEAIRAGVGRPEAHGALGELLEPRHLKYGLLELRVAAFLNPRDMRARRHLVRGLVEVRLDDAARTALEELMRDDPGWANDSTLVHARRTLDARSGTDMAVAEF